MRFKDPSTSPASSSFWSSLRLALPGFLLMALLAVGFASQVNSLLIYWGP